MDADRGVGRGGSEALIQKVGGQTAAHLPHVLAGPAPTNPGVQYPLIIVLLITTQTLIFGGYGSSLFCTIYSTYYTQKDSFY